MTKGAVLFLKTLGSLAMIIVVFIVVYIGSIYPDSEKMAKHLMFLPGFPIAAAHFNLFIAARIGE